MQSCFDRDRISKESQFWESKNEETLHAVFEVDTYDRPIVGGAVHE